MSVLRRLLGGGDAAIARARRPQAMADGLAVPPLEGLDWLGRPPSARAPRLYRLLVWLAERFLIGLCDLRLDVRGQAGLPPGGYLAFCALHRSWVDPLVLVHALPREPRVWFMGSGATAFDRRWKERLLHRIGGLLPVWRGGTDIAVHERATRAVVEEGAVLALFAEGAIAGPPDRPARLRDGAALLALRTGAPIVPVAICGAEELYRGKHIAVRILSSTTPAALLGASWQGPPPPGTREELRAAHALTAAIAGRLADAVAEAYPGTVDPPGRRRRWTWLTRLMR